MNKKYAIISLVILLLMSVGCANVVPPMGGPKDTTPPKMKSITPADSQVNLRPSKITIIFDKYMDLDNVAEKISMTPLITRNPTVLNYGKKVVISIDDSLLMPNTTYVLSLGNALKDNREGTPYPDFTYTFSTGTYFDSLQLSGKVFNAHTAVADTGSTVLLYDAENFTDSAVFSKMPMYITKVKSDGTFTFQGLPAKAFKIFAINSKEKGYLYMPGRDWFAFTDIQVNPLLDSSKKIILKLFKEDKDIEEETNTSENKRSMRSKTTSIPSLSDKDAYRVLIDTQIKNTSTQELNKPLIIVTKNTLKNISWDKVFLSFEKEGVELQSTYQYERKDTIAYLKNQWQPNTQYTLRLVKGWATDTLNNELPPSKYIFRTHKADRYGNAVIRFPDSLVNNGYVFKLTLGTDSISVLPINDTSLQFKMMTPGTYAGYLIQDLNQDSVFTTGDYIFHRQPEPVYLRHAPLVIKGGWDHEYDFIEKGTARKPSKEDEK